METLRKGRVAEWSKALALGASPKGRGFKPHLYQIFFILDNLKDNLYVKT